MAAFYDIAPCSLVEVNRCSEVILPPSSVLIFLMMEAVSTSETSVTFYQTTRRNIPQDSHLHGSGWLEIYLLVTKTNAMPARKFKHEQENWVVRIAVVWTNFYPSSQAFVAGKLWMTAVNQMLLQSW
jgi:hypothetical protein